MKIAIIGSRKWPENMKHYVLHKFMGYLAQESIDLLDVIIVSGGAAGVDTIARELAQAFELPFIEFLPSDDNRLPYTTRVQIRNEEVIMCADRVLAFEKQGGSPGTQHACSIARLLKKPLEVFRL